MNFFFPSVIFAVFPSVSKVKREHGFRTGLADTWSNSGFPNQSVWLHKNIEWKKLLDIFMFFWSRLWWTFLRLKQRWPVYEAALQLLIRKGIADINSSVLPLFSCSAEKGWGKPAEPQVGVHEHLTSLRSELLFGSWTFDEPLLGSTASPKTTASTVNCHFGANI